MHDALFVRFLQALRDTQGDIERIGSFDGLAGDTLVEVLTLGRRP